MSPKQILRAEIEPDKATADASGLVLLIHPDFLWNTALVKKMAQYDFFDYAVNEALFLSEKEELIINGIIQNIRQEYRSNLDKFSRQIIIRTLKIC